MSLGMFIISSTVINTNKSNRQNKIQIKS